ncbi:MAG: two-component regulator propeller domain-containing protein [Candidatus Latescibacter sp.]|nr:two-component regulator propeller domain-containing protein [Candidatus Latescibacter sp.]
MKRILWLLLLFISPTMSADAAPFGPAVLKINGPAIIPYTFDGKNLSVPVTVTGTPANVTFLVFTRGKAAAIKNTRNGYLGWHYVNGIDTCIYVSTPYQFSPGSTSITWNGKDKAGGTAPPGEYTYYLWGFDNISPKVKMTQFLRPEPWSFRTILEKDAKGIALARPVLYMSDQNRGTAVTAFKHTLKKWVVGNDPEDAALVETCNDMGWTDVGGLAFLPTDQTKFFHCWLKGDTKTKVVRAWTWVPNSTAVLRTDWGANGEYTYTVASPAGWDFGPGVVSDGKDYLFCVNADMSNTGKESQLIYLNVNNGTEIKRLDLSPWWVNLTEGTSQVGGQYTGGPFTLQFRKNVLFGGSHQSCVNQVIDPYYQSADDAILWVNRNGDYVGDHNFETTSKKPWVCNDYNVGPYKYSLSPDDNLFSIFPCFDLGAQSFGLYAPDGTGIGYKSYGGDMAGQKYGTDIIDYGSPYDGIYTTQNGVLGSDGRSYTIPAGFWFVAEDSFKGIISTSGSYIWVSSPAGGEVWGTASVHTITWIAKDVKTVKIEYSTDTGVSWKTLVDNVDATLGSYSWTPAGIQSSACLVRITSTADSKIQGTSYGAFTITPPTLKVISPNGGEVWEAKIQQKITWSSFGVDAVKIEYSTDKGSTWNLIVASTPTSTGSYTWIAPDKVSSDCLVRISDASNPSLTDMSDGTFKLMASFIQVISPNGGEVWESGNDHPITWNSSKGVLNVVIEFSSDGGSSWSVIISSVNSSAGSVNWKIPRLSSTKCMIRISDALNSAFFDVSDITFSIIPSTALWTTYLAGDGIGSNYIWTVTDDPRGGIWIGTGQAWSGSGGVSYYNGISWINYTTKNSGIASDNIYAIAVDKNGIVWIGNTWNGLSKFDGKTWINYTKDNSPLPDNDIRDLIVDHNNVLWITTWHGGVASLNGTIWKTYGAVPHGEILGIDRDNSLWVGYNFAEGGVSHFDGITWNRYHKSDGLAGDYVLGIAIDSDGKKWFSTSGGITTFDGTKWTTYDFLKGQNVQSVAIDRMGVKWFGYSGGAASFDGVEWKSYNASNSELNNNVWRIAVDLDNVKWFGTRGGGVTSFSYQTGPFVTVVSPNGGELWEAGSAQEIAWVSKDVSRLKIEYSTDAGLNWKLLADNVDASLKSYIWTTPQIQSFHCLVRLVDTSNYKVTDTGNNEFTISPPFVKVTAPNGGEKWATGTSHAVTWVSVGVKTVRIEYSTDSGKTWKTVTDTVDAANGSWPWTIPATESAACLVKVTDPSTPARTDTGDGVFTILRPYITVTAPNGGEVWSAGKNNTVTWVADGVENVKVEYSVDGGVSWNSITKSIAASSGAFTFNPLNVQSTQCLVRVSDQASGAVSDKSDAVFTITSIVSSVGETIPREFAVFQNTPNPFNPRTTIIFTLPQAGQVAVNVYNLTGQRVDSILDGRLSAGRHMVSWNAARFSAGIYFCLVRTEKEEKTIKMLLLK